jgi:sugar phosphate isomerase/epimerase
MAPLIKKLGFDGVDLPVRPIAGAITPQDAPQKLPEAAKLFAEQGLTLQNVVSGITGSEDDLEQQLATLAQAGVKTVRLGGWHVPEGQDPRPLLEQARKGVSQMQPLLEKHGLSAAIQNHSGNYLEVNVSACLRIIDGCDPKLVGVQCDFGHLPIAGEPFDLAIDLLGPYLNSANLKCMRKAYTINRETGQLQYTNAVVPLWDGMTDVPAILKKLKSVGYSGSLSIHAEYRSHFHRIEGDTNATSELIA